MRTGGFRLADYRIMSPAEKEQALERLVAEAVKEIPMPEERPALTRYDLPTQAAVVKTTGRRYFERPLLAPIERFWARVQKNGDDGCWIWTGATGMYGYGDIKIDRRHVRAHRFAYEYFVGPVPAGLDLDHLCRNRACVNPAHLEPVTRGENVLRGQSPIARKRESTHCPNGHMYSKEGKVNTRGWRTCLACGRLRKHRRKSDA